jgi:hypothetical protein
VSSAEHQLALRNGRGLLIPPLSQAISPQHNLCYTGNFYNLLLIKALDYDHMRVSWSENLASMPFGELIDTLLIFIVWLIEDVYFFSLSTALRPIESAPFL